MHLVEDYGPVRALTMGRRPLGFLPPVMTVRCFAVDGLLVDAGLATHTAPVLEFARSEGVARVAITHHHEDHSGGAAALQRAGLPVDAAPATRELVARGFSTRFYQAVVWGPAPTARLGSLAPEIETDRYRFQVLPAPGHCEDQVVLFEAGQGWLFSGDAFLAEKVKLFRGDEDFAATVASLARLVDLDFDALYCAHRPCPTGGRVALRSKLDHFRSLEQQVRALHAEGLDIAEITRRVLGREPLGLWLASRGDLSKRNLVRSILFGPVPRPEVAAVVRDLAG